MLISQNQAWGRHRPEVNDEPTATLEHLDWADGISFGTLTRFGYVAAQLKLFLDQAGQLWAEGRLINKLEQDGNAALQALVRDYVEQAERHAEIPMHVPLSRYLAHVEE